MTDCVKCGCEKSRVINSRNINKITRRRRECLECKFRYTTDEIPRKKSRREI